MPKHLLMALICGAILMIMPADDAQRDLRSPELKACLHNGMVKREQLIRACRRESARLRIGSDDELCRSVHTIRYAYGICTAQCGAQFRR